MLELVQVTKIIHAEYAKVWTAISSIGGLERWFPIIADCRVTGEGVGALREMDLVDGGRIVDRIDSIDQQQRLFRYRRIEHPFPVSQYVGVVTVRETPGGNAAICWSVAIDANPDAPENLLDFIHQALSDGIDGMERDLR